MRATTVKPSHTLQVFQKVMLGSRISSLLLPVYKYLFKVDNEHARLVFCLCLFKENVELLNPSG